MGPSRGGAVRCSFASRKSRQTRSSVSGGGHTNATLHFTRAAERLPKRRAPVADVSARGVAFTGPVVRPEGGPPPMAFFLDQDSRRFLLVERDD